MPEWSRPGASLVRQVRVEEENEFFEVRFDELGQSFDGVNEWSVLVSWGTEVRTERTQEAIVQIRQARLLKRRLENQACAGNGLAQLPAVEYDRVAAPKRMRDDCQVAKAVAIEGLHLDSHEAVSFHMLPHIQLPREYLIT